MAKITEITSYSHIGSVAVLTRQPLNVALEDTEIAEINMVEVHFKIKFKDGSVTDVRNYNAV